MKARKKEKFDVVQVTQDLINEPGQTSIRALIKGVTQVELFPSRICISTRYARYDFNEGDWLLKGKDDSVIRVTDTDFKMNYETFD